MDLSVTRTVEKFVRTALAFWQLMPTSAASPGQQTGLALFCSSLACANRVDSLVFIIFINSHNAPPRTLGAFGSCVSDCEAAGVQTRTVTCYNPDGTTATCPSSAPNTTQPCTGGACSYDWLPGARGGGDYGSRYAIALWRSRLLGGLQHDLRRRSRITTRAVLVESQHSGGQLDVQAYHHALFQPCQAYHPWTLFVLLFSTLVC